MKRFLLAMLVGMMIVASASFAAAEVTVGGEMEVRYDLWHNISLNDKTANFNTINFFDQRVILSVDAKIAEGLEAFVDLDTENVNWGQATSAGNIPTYLNHEFSGIAVRQAWINFMVPGMPVGMKIGHQPLALGHGIWLDTHREGSDAILVYSKPMPQLLVAAAYVQGSQSLPVNPANAGAFGRLGGGLTSSTLSATAPSFAFKSDADFYAVLANYTWMENNTAGINFTYVDDQSSLETIGAAGANIWATNTALVMDGTIAGLTYKGEVDWLYANTKGLLGGSDYNVSAWAMMLGGSYNLGVANVGMEVAYGTGNNSGRQNIFYNPGADVVAGGAPTTGMDHAYYTPYNSTSYNYAFLYNDKIGQGPLGTGGGMGFGDGFGGIGLANTGYVKLSANFAPMDKMTAGMDVLYLRASEKATPTQSNDLGWEIDANVGYKIYDNLALNVTGGVFVPGKWYAYDGHAAVPAGNAAILSDTANPLSPLKRDTAWGLETKLSVKF